MQTDPVINIKNDLSGFIIVKFKQGASLDEYCRSKIKDYNPDRFEALAIRVYYGREFRVILYAIDKYRMEGTNFNKNKMPVKKFKLDSSFIKEIMSIVSEGNFTVTTGNYPLSDMEVINK